MSLVSTYVRGTDGYFYQNPVLSGNDWFICFDDDDPIELVIKLTSKLTPEEILNKIGLKYSDLREAGISGRMFGKEYIFDDATSYYFELKSRIDPKFIRENDGRTKKLKGDCVFYDPK